MPPKSKKAVDKAKAKVIEDKTFGLKNKNRSTKVQQYVQTVTHAVKQGNPNERKTQAENEAKKKAREAKKAFDEEVAKLFNAAPVVKAPPPPEEEDKNLGVNPEDYLWTAEDFDGVERDDRRLEEQLDAEREALKERTDLTPVTEETFQAWKKKTREAAAEKEAQRLKKAKAAGSGLRGRDLWEHDKDLFVDDDEADDEFYECEEIVEEDES
eukprot:Tbor_TRINITY_DN4460_c0_g1::TRINITY_DN4460_c0_g1_i1::g.8036::m.8036